MGQIGARHNWSRLYAHQQGLNPLVRFLGRQKHPIMAPAVGKKTENLPRTLDQTTRENLDI